MIRTREYGVSILCDGCGEFYTFYVHEEDYNAWFHAYKPIHEAFPYLTWNECATIRTGVCDGCAEAAQEEEDEWTDEDLDELFEPYGYFLIDPESDDPSYESDYYVDCD